MPVYRIVQKAHSVDIVDPYGRCVDTILDGSWAGAPEPRLEATDAYVAELVEQGERSGRYIPGSFDVHRTYDSATGVWSTSGGRRRPTGRGRGPAARRQGGRTPAD